jgi:hypothetical protein
MNVVTEEVLNVALISYHRTRPHEGAVVAMRAALAVVAPIIAAQERERAIVAAASALDAYGKWNGEITPERLMKPITAAIRALGDAT